MGKSMRKLWNRFAKKKNFSFTIVHFIFVFHVMARCTITRVPRSSFICFFLLVSRSFFLRFCCTSWLYPNVKLKSLVKPFSILILKSAAESLQFFFWFPHRSEFCYHNFQYFCVWWIYVGFTTLRFSLVSLLSHFDFDFSTCRLDSKLQIENNFYLRLFFTLNS